MERAGDEIVRVRDVTKDFRPGLGLRRKRILHGISFSVRRGEIFGFVGPNGAGKTTTLKLLMGLIHATSGEAEILGHRVQESAYRRHVGFLPENPYFYDFLTGREILSFYAKLSGVSRADRAKRVAELLERVSLTHAADARLRTYSKGMLQRVGIAQALVHDPQVVFLDEPMSGLDPIGRKEIRDLILELHADGKTVFMNTHILSDVEMVCDRVAIIAEGRIRYEGPTEDFLGADRQVSDVVVTGIAPELIERFEQEYGAQVGGRGDHIELRVPEKHVSDLARAALGAGAELRSVTPHRVSLESIFLSAVEGGTGTPEPGERAQGQEGVS
ncbi:MAG: ABC transporter ATP-binding protein [Myxococcales bacterium]|nr:ABC transporter ATP-binding protein [Myxococcales bacterium]